MMRVTKTLGYCLVLCGLGHGLADSCPAGWETHEVEQLNGKLSRIKSSAGIQIVSQRWGLGAVHYPYMIHMPEKERLLLLVNWGKKPRNKSGVARSDDGGRTWKKPRLVTDAWSVGLTYLGAGNAVFLSQKSVTGPSDRYRFSRDFGQSWPDELPAPGYTDGKPFYEDSQFLVDRDSRTGKIVRLWATGKAPGQACLFRSTTDRGRTWSKYRHVPQWGRTGEIVLHRAANGNLVAACRANIPRFVDGKIDHWSGLGVSLSSDNGKTWSKLNILYAWGRHLSSMVTLPNGHIALTYVVRKGYVETTDGFPQFGIEAVVSRDHGRTWDLDHRYLLATWKGDQKGPGRWHASGQRTSTVLLPDGTLVTAFGAWYRNIVLVRWRIHRQRLSPGSTIADAAYDSKTRNVFAPKISRYARTDPGEKK